MQILVTSNFDIVRERVERFREQLLPIGAGVLTKQVKTLSQEQQVDYTGVPFAPLVPAYRKRKIKAGHPGIPNLTFSGKFMASIGMQDNDTIGPSAELQPQAEGLNKKREIWGVHPDSIRLVEHAASDAWRTIVAS